MKLVNYCGALLILLSSQLLTPGWAAPAVSGVTESTILIGQSVSRSGPTKALGEETELGIRLYFDSINAQGGIHGRRLTLVSLDDGNQPGRARDNTLTLIEKERVFALLGYVGTDTNVAALPVFFYHQVPFIGPVTGSDLMRVPLNRYVFNTRAGFVDEATRIVEQLTSVGIRNIAVFYQSDAYGLDGVEAVGNALDKLGLRIVARGSIDRTSSDAQSAVFLIDRAKPEAVILFCGSKQAVSFIRAMHAQGSTAQFYNTSLVGSTALVQELGNMSRGLIVSQVTPHPWSATTTLVREYQRLLAATGKQPSYGSLEGYITARTLVEGLRRAGRNLTRESLVAALENMGNVDLGGINIKFSPANHNGSTYVDLTIVGVEGRFLH